MTKETALDIFQKTGALMTGHYRLTSGLHSPQYFQCARVLQYPQYTEQLCKAILDSFSEQQIDCVISPAVGGLIVGQECARLLGCRAIFTEREGGVMTLRRGFELAPGTRLLVVEDVITTGGSVQEVLDVALECGADTIGVGCIVDRSGGIKQFDVPLVSVVQMEVVTYPPGDCPLCKQELSLVKPGSRTLK